MSSILCQTTINNSISANVIMLSEALMKKWDCTAHESIQVKIGNKSLPVRVVATKAKGNKIGLSSTAAKQLHLPYTGPTGAVMHQKTLRLGPVIGILTASYTGNLQNPFGSRSRYFRLFIEASLPEKPFFFVFTPEMVDWSNQTISGWFWKKGIKGQSSRWVRYVSPVPDVIYDRVFSRTLQASSRIQSCLTKLKETNQCQIFNPGFFNKWTIHQMLSQDTRTAHFVPETYLSPSTATLQEIMEKHRMVYLKPNSGYSGRGIFRITHHPKEGYFCRYHNGKSNLHRFQSLEKLLQYYFGKNRSTQFKKYLVQQGIHLIKYQDRPVDFRVHMHKDKTGEWQVIAVGAKAAGSGCVTTHIRTGGSLLSTDEVLQSAFRQEADMIKNSIENTAIIVANILDQNINEPIGELGMDIGVDSTKKVWLFEVNSKPGRHIFHHHNLKGAGRQSAKCITDFSLKLADFV
jgi:hypothetical protein